MMYLVISALYVFEINACYIGVLCGTEITLCVGTDAVFPCRKFVTVADSGQEQHMHVGLVIW